MENGLERTRVKMKALYALIAVYVVAAQAQYAQGPDAALAQAVRRVRQELPAWASARIALDTRKFRFQQPSNAAALAKELRAVQKGRKELVRCEPVRTTMPNCVLTEVTSIIAVDRASATAAMAEFTIRVDTQQQHGGKSWIYSILYSVTVTQQSNGNWKVSAFRVFAQS